MVKKILSRYCPEDIIKNKKINYVFIKLNSKCNARCHFCSSWKIQKDNIKVDIHKLAENLMKANPLEVNLSGGEIFLSENLWTLLQATKRQINWSITTNGSYMHPEIIDKLVSNNLKRFFISVDSYIEVQNDRSRGIPDVSSKIWNGIKYIQDKKYDLKIIINHVVSNKNYDQIGDMLVFFKNLGVDAINLIPIKDMPNYNLSLEQIKFFYNEIEGKLSKEQITKEFFVNGYYQIFGNSLYDYKMAVMGNYNYVEKTHCIMPYNTVFIDCSSGNVFPCDTTIWRKNCDDYVMGNIIEQTLEEIWEGSKFERFRTEMHPEMKHDCYKYCDPNNSF